MLTMLYVMSFLDRSNIGNANIAGMSEDLGLVGNQYNVYDLCLTPWDVMLTGPLDLLDGLLLHICPAGSPVQHDAQDSEAFHMDLHYDG